MIQRRLVTFLVLTILLTASSPHVHARCHTRVTTDRASEPLPNSIRLPKKECTTSYIGNGAGCICYLFHQARAYPEEVEPYCKAAYNSPSSLRAKCGNYVIKGKISQVYVEETLMWSVENCLTTTVAAPAARILSSQSPVSAVGLSMNLAMPAERFFFLPALLPIFGKVVLKASIFAGKQLVRRAVTNVATRHTAAQAAKKAIGKGVRGLFRKVFRRRARRAAQRKFNAAERLRKRAEKAANGARKRSAEVAAKVRDAEKAAREGAKRIAEKAKNKARELVKEAKKFVRKEARAVAECVRERVDELKTGEGVLVEIDAGTVREEVEQCLKSSKVLCVGLVGAEAVRGEADPESLSFFADVATCLSDNEAVCVGVLTAKFVEKELSEREFVGEMTGCFPGSERCGPQIARLVIGGDVTVEAAIKLTKACEKEEEDDGKKDKTTTRIKRS